jgi:acyl carrier protein
MTETTTITEATALQWLAELFEEPARNLTPDTLRAEIPAWDSLGVLTLMAALDERFGILLTDQEMRAMTNVGDILEVLRRHGKLNGE